MSKPIPYTDSLAAADKQAGFDYQFYIFLLKCFELQNGQSIGYEQLDDVHIDFEGKTTYIQVKHTIGFSAVGERPNLTQKDIDLWKTLANWVNIINDPSSGRGSESEQLAHVKKSEFILISNKSFSKTNSVVKLFNDYKNSIKTITQLRDELKMLIIESDPQKYSEVDKYIKVFTSQSDNWLDVFVKSVEFTLEIDDIIYEVKAKMKERFMIHSDDQAEDVFNCLFTNFKSDIYDHVAKGNRSIVFDYDRVKGMTSACLYKINKPIVRSYETLELPENLEDQIFIKQLIDIGDIQVGDLETIINYTRFKVLMAQNMKDWEQNHELLPTSKSAFIDNCILKWKAVHTKHHRNPFNDTLTEEILKKAALDVIDEIRIIVLTVSDVSLDSMLSHGQFYALSDELKIGWSHDWKTRYFAHE